MAEEAVNSVLAGGEEDQDPIPGSQDDTSLDSGPGGAVGPTGESGAPISTPPIAPAPSPVQIDSSQKVHPHMAILAGLLKGILGGIQNAPGNPRNAFDRGFMNASPNQQQLQAATLSKAKSESDLARIQASMAGLQLLHAQHMGERLPQDEQDRLIQMSNDYYKYLTDKEGVEVSATGDIKGAKDLATLKNNNDPNVKNGLGVFQPLIHRDEEGKVVASVVWLPHLDVLQKDQDLGPNPNFDAEQPESDQNPKRLIVHAGIPTKGVQEFAKIINTMAQKATKDQAGDLARLNKLPEDNPDQIQAKKDQLQQWLDDKSNDSVFKRQNQADVQSTVNRLGPALEASEQRRIKEAQQKMFEVTIPGEQAKQAIKNKGNYFHWIGSDGETRVGKGDEVPEGVDATPIGNTDKFAMYMGEAHVSNIVQTSMNRLHQDIDEHPEIFDNAKARNILATTLEQVDRASVGALVAGTGASIPIPSGTGAMINTALQNGSLRPETADALKQYIADYKAAKDKGLAMQMEMQGGKIGRGAAAGFKAIIDQFPNGETADSATAVRQMSNLQDTQEELSKKYGNFGDFQKVPAYKPVGKGASSTSKRRDEARRELFEEQAESKAKKFLRNVGEALSGLPH